VGALPHANQLRSALREYFPAALSAFEDLADRDAVAVLQRFPDPRSAARAGSAQVRAALRRGGRTRNLDRRATDVRQHLQVRHLQAPDAVADAFAASVQAQAAVVAVMSEQIHHLESEIADALATHPDTETLASLPGLGPILAARVLGEFGDDASRYPTAKARKNYAGTSPLTVASGKKCTVTARYVRNKRLYDAIDQWAFCSLTRSRGCRAFYDARRAKGDSHHQALRALGNRLVGVLHGCLRNHSTYSEEAAWSHRHDTAQPIPA
jgi:transposase